MVEHAGYALQIRATIAGLILICTASPVSAQDSSDTLRDLARRIVEKRSEVESLSNDLELMKTDFNEQMRSIAVQRADIEAQINRERLRLSQIERDLGSYSAAISENRLSMDRIEPLVSEVLEDIRGYVIRGLPFKVSERLGEIETLERLLADDALETDKILARMWNFIDAEFRLTQESGLYHQTIILDDQPQLAEVARLGMVFLYFKTLNGIYGYVVPAEDGWRFSRSRSRDDDRKIAALFDSLRKNLREGFFDIPNPQGSR